MKMNRRNALIGLGAVATGAGAVFGSGAFTTVEAERTAPVNVASDANAFLALEIGPGRAHDEGYIRTDGADATSGQIEFYFDGDENAEADGLLDDATTTFGELLTVTNNGTNDVDISVNAYDAQGDPVDGVLTVTASEGDDITPLTSGGSANLDFEFDLTGTHSAGDIETIEIVATENTA